MEERYVMIDVRYTQQMQARGGEHCCYFIAQGWRGEGTVYIAQAARFLKEDAEARSYCEGGQRGRHVIGIPESEVGRRAFFGRVAVEELKGFLEHFPAVHGPAKLIEAK